MKVFELNRHIFVLLSILPAPKNKTARFKRRNIIFTISTLIMLVSGLIASTGFVIKNVCINPGESLYSLFLGAGFANQIYLLIMGIILRSKFVEMFQKLQKIYDES